MRRAARVDENQPAIVEALRKVGAEVTHLHPLGGGISDLLVSFRQRWWILECKSENGELNVDQRRWIGRQKAPVYLVRSAEEAVQFLTEQMPDWMLGLEVRAINTREHICEGPPPGEEEDEVAEVPVASRARLIDRVQSALQASWRSHQKLSENDLCEMLGASKASKRVEKALRELCREGKAHREGNNRNALYWATTVTSS